VLFKNQRSETLEGNTLTKEYSDAIFNRSGNIKQLIVTI